MENDQEKKEAAPPAPESGAPKPEQEGGADEAPKDGIVTVSLVFDMNTNQLMMRSKAPTVLILGILGYAQSMITQNQLLQRLQNGMAKGGIERPPAIVRP